MKVWVPGLTQSHTDARACEGGEGSHQGFSALGDREGPAGAMTEHVSLWAGRGNRVGETQSRQVRPPAPARPCPRATSLLALAVSPAHRLLPKLGFFPLVPN